MILTFFYLNSEFIDSFNHSPIIERILDLQFNG